MKIAILGMGVSGLAALKLAKSQGLETYAINQGEPKTWKNYQEVSKLLDSKYILSEEAALKMKFDELVLSPGIALTHHLVQKNKTISEIEFASRYIQIPMIAITGTNGKTTTCTLLARILEELGKNVFLGGNIGLALSECALSHHNYDYAVVEVSSFQLESIESFHPKVAVILNISPSHSERYHNVQEYAEAKYRIALNLDESDFFLAPPEIEIETKAKKISVTSEQILATQTILNFARQKAIGKHYPEMYTFLRLILKSLDLDAGLVLQRFIDEFAGLEHRIEFVAKKSGRAFYNDSKSTNMASTCNAIMSFDGPVALILGGQLRSQDISFLDELVLIKSHLRKVYLFGESAPLIHKTYGGVLPTVVYERLSEVIENCEEGIILFSPAFPSFDQFQNYKDRGEKFKKWVNELA